MYRHCNCNNNNNNDDYDNDSCNMNTNSCGCSDENMYEQSCPCSMNAMNNYNNQNSTNSCSCGFESSNNFPNTLLYAHSYVPHQYMNNVYTPCLGLKLGTIFPELVSPYCPGQSQEVTNYLRNSKDFKGGCM